MTNTIELKNISKTFEDDLILDNLSLNIKQGEFLTLLGPSGCGKTTTLRILAGFLTPDSGEVIFEGKKINEIPPYERNINTVFQKYALFPNMNVYENVAFGLKIKKVNKKEIDKRVSEMLKLVNLSGYEKRSIEALSGGQQQRIAIARALINEPKVLLLDEPLGALDLKLRQGMQVELKNIQQRVGITFVYVTHDQEEALSMSDKIVVMNNGLIQQIGSPTDIYNEPVNSFVADFIGESNIINGTMLDDYSVVFSNNKFVCVDKGFKENEEVEVVVRPEDIDLVSEDKGMMTGIVEDIVFKGVHYEMNVNVDGFRYLVQSTLSKEVGQRVGVNIIPDNIHIMKKGK
ncbi:spermidine/putrescine ABC transporter ATP-binding protein [Miniphocaeibacter massiliensis]|uniref:spermidine/putrescine ABC transporter ATP-binding protein n=1 Tax=Miniphocaeibacter massiliensis TaxID=2041841 RepID=UPI000C0750B7|nr:spermidine/putrescine ABC transporter ATP-binding protein [Miniphocaeibacter massiliensis]